MIEIVAPCQKVLVEDSETIEVETKVNATEAVLYLNLCRTRSCED